MDLTQSSGMQKFRDASLLGWPGSAAHSTQASLGLRVCWVANPTVVCMVYRHHAEVWAG